MLISGSTSKIFGDNIARKLKREQVQTVDKRFVDGEYYCRLIEPLPLPEEVFIIQSTYFPQNDNLMELLMLCTAASENGAEKIHVISPYFGYSRSDRVVLKGEVANSFLVQKLLYSAGATHLAVCDIHNPAVLDSQKLISQNLTLEKEVAEFFGSFLSEEDLILGPDQGALKRAQDVAEILGCGASALVKKRDPVTNKTQTKEPEISVKGKKVLIVDDIIATGGSMVATIDLLYSKGAEEVSVCVSHITHLRPEELEETIVPKVAHFVSSNSIPTTYSKIDLTEKISSYIQSF
ncbi:MAG: ribose-phosphate diphosphokinase [Candidatus Heimdallarchaeota archaeon]|nr:ribose-phosphate diphosphokinase [Candidatus Heimdallarchaeota archaeon]MCK5048120.1 ribose-phosphate diphosphokinase [Candidatus Heimdallarchaeota archaeon]